MLNWRVGLSGTDLDALIAIAETDDNMFHMRDNNDDDDEWDEGRRVVDKFNPVQMARRKQRALEVRRAKLKLVDANKLTLMQKELCASRIKLLTFLDRLELYELILGGPIKAREMFDAQRYKDMRSKSILDVTLDYARVINSLFFNLILLLIYQFFF